MKGAQPEISSQRKVNFYIHLEEKVSKWLKLTTPFAVWRLPNSELVEYCSNVETQIVENDLEQIGSGFVLSPFIPLPDNHVVYIPATTYGNSEEEVDKEQESQSESVLALPEFNSEVSSDDPVDGFRSWVREACDVLDEEQFSKVVLARNKVIQLSDQFKLIAAFQKLCAQLPNSFVSLTYTPEFGLWLGASPEPLIQLKGNSFYTVALAGTQAYTEGKKTSEASWTQKEIEEQALVSRYIIDCFKKIRLREYLDIGPKTIISGNLMHLRTEFWVDMASTNFPQLGTVMLRLLHPTSAVCGTPKDKALDFIHTHEKFERKLFSGYLGPVKLNGASYLFVNLRCAEIFKGYACLYAGAGITLGSDPEKEWKETEMKMDTIGRFLIQ